MIKSVIKKVCKIILPASAYRDLRQKWNDSKIKIYAVRSGGGRNNLYSSRGALCRTTM